MTTRRPRPQAPPLAVTLRQALAQGWHTLDALEALAGRATGARLRVHAALGELRAEGCALEERVERGVAEVRLAPSTLPDHPTLREPSPPVEGEPVDAASHYLGRGREEEDADIDAVRAARGRDLRERVIASLPPGATAREIMFAEAAEIVRMRGPAEPATALDAYAQPCEPSGPVEVAEGPAPSKGPGPGAQCAVCGVTYAAHWTHLTPAVQPKGHPFTPKPRGRPRVAALDAPPVESAAAAGGTEPETSRGEAPGDQANGKQEQSEATDVGTTDDGAEGSGAASHPANGGGGARHGEQPIVHERAPRQDASAGGRAPRRGGKADEPVGLTRPPPCRPPACHADDIHVPSAVRGFARPLCERHRRWVEEAGGTVAAGGLAGVVRQ